MIFILTLSFLKQIWNKKYNDILYKWFLLLILLMSSFNTNTSIKSIIHNLKCDILNALIESNDINLKYDIIKKYFAYNKFFKQLYEKLSSFFVFIFKCFK